VPFALLALLAVLTLLALLALGQALKLDFLWAGFCLFSDFCINLSAYSDLIELRPRDLALPTMFV
jgi:hypothetical protein